MSSHPSDPGFGSGSVVDIRKSRVVHLAEGRDRARAQNSRTGIVLASSVSNRRSFREMFLQHYREIRAAVTHFGHAGVAVVAIHELRNVVAGSLCLAAKVGIATSAIIGRHNSADLYLDGDPSLSLRHLAVVVEPTTSFAASHDPRYRVLDLHTGTSFEDEQGGVLEALTAEGPAFIRCGGYALLFLPTGDATPWPDAADDAWDCIPERVYVDERCAEPDRWDRNAAPAPVADATRLRDVDFSRRVTYVGAVAGPVASRQSLLAEGEQPIGTLHVTGDGRRESLIIGPRAAARGILLGRYDRCESSARTVLTDEATSRVHLLLLQVADKFYAIDTGSSNGTWLAVPSALGEPEWERARVVPLSEHTLLSLGSERACITWSPSATAAPPKVRP